MHFSPFSDYILNAKNIKNGVSHRFWIDYKSNNVYYLI